jgi:hypothetical protein
MFNTIAVGIVLLDFKLTCAAIPTISRYVSSRVLYATMLFCKVAITVTVAYTHFGQFSNASSSEPKPCSTPSPLESSYLMAGAYIYIFN